MPTYEFRCELGHATDQFFGNMSSAPSEIDCPECGARAVRQVSGGIGLLFKGSGFYITDYGKDGKKPRTADTAGARSEGGTGEASKNGSGEPAKASSGESSGEGKPAGTASKAESTASSTKPKNE